ncbi:MAG: hypothetical protein OEZ06_23410, partial [Myxococcales bacterium]|nr:hypothetical protein [Myxococcales bacterium]
RLRKGQLESERARLVEAVKLGGGELKVLVDEMKRVEGDLTALEEQIAVAQARLQPLLLPNAKAVEDFVVGRDSIFEGDQARDRQFLERVLEGIFVYADGTIVLRFQQDSLFAPVRAYEFHPDRAFERGTVADRWFHGLNSGHAAGLAKVFEGAELRVVEQKGGPRFRLSALRSPPLHTVSVPRGI